MIRLPDTSQEWPQLRVVTAPGWGANSDQSAAGWIIEPSATGSRAGYEVLEVERAVLPQIGTARLRYRMGVIDGQLAGVLSDGANPRAWNPATMTAEAPDLWGKEIRIQQRIGANSWKTIFWGQVEYQEDTGWPASLLPAGERIYHLTDALARTRKWRLTTHVFQPSSGSSVGLLSINPVGYNASWGNTVRGNKGSQNLSIYGWPVVAHTHPNGGGQWDDQQVINHCLAITRPNAEPVFRVPDTESTAYLVEGQASAWSVNYGDDAHALVLRVADWKRGRGVMFLDWTETPSSDTTVQQMTCLIACKPPFVNDLSFADPAGGSTLSFPGAGSANTLIDVDLIGDQRCVDSALSLGDTSAHQYDGVITIGDPIECVCTLSVLDGSLAQRWTTADEAALEAIAQNRRKGDRWRPVGQRFGLPVDWAGLAGNGNTSASTRATIRTKDDGTLDDRGTFSPLSVRILQDLPILEGYLYNGSVPQKADGGGTATETTLPNRKPALALIREASETFLKATDGAYGLSLRIDGNDIWLASESEVENGTRAIGTNSGLSPKVAPAAVAVTVALAGEPLRMATWADGVSESTAAYIKIINAPGLTLHHIAAEAIYDLSETTGTAPLRNACRTGGGAGILRDDRRALAARHAMASRWYGLKYGSSTSNELRRSASWALRCGGMAGSFATVTADGEDDATIEYPRIGEIVQYLHANGSKLELNTPITRIRYDHQTGVTSWETNWQDLEYSR